MASDNLTSNVRGLSTDSGSNFEIKPKTKETARSEFVPVKWWDSDSQVNTSIAYNTNQYVKKNNINNRKIGVIMGAGIGLGGAVAETFAQNGMIIIVARRNGDKLIELLQTINKNKNDEYLGYGFSIDARNEQEIINFISYIDLNFGRISFACFNIGANVNFSIRNTTSRVFFKVWEMACYSAFLFGREVSKHMLKHKDNMKNNNSDDDGDEDDNNGTIIFTGATASIRGNSGFSAFSSAKAGCRMLAQSMHRELSPQGIHVAHVIVDGAIDGVFVQSLQKRGGVPFKTIMKPKSIAQNYWMLYKQPKDSWTFEMDVRPFDEKHTS